MSDLRPLTSGLWDVVKRDLEMFEFLLQDLNMTRAQIESAMDAKSRAEQAEFEERLRTSRIASQ